MEYEIYRYDNINGIRKELISNVCTFNWSDNITKEFTSFNFETNEELFCGNWIEFYDCINKRTVFWGKIENKTVTEQDIYKYNGKDYGAELKKKPIDIQFNGKPFQDAIQDVCSKNNIDVGTIEPTETVYIKKNYRNINKVSDVLDDIYIKTLDEKIENNYYFTCKDGKVNLLKFPYVEQIYGYIGRRMKINSFDYIIKFNKTITSNKNPNSQNIETSDNKQKQEKNDLENISLTVYADSQLQTGIKTNIYNKKIGLDGLYLMTSSNHRISGSIEEVDITAKRLGPRIDNKNKKNNKDSTQNTIEQIQKKETTIIDVLKNELEKRNNPTDLKAAIVGKVVQLSPIIVSISDGHVLLKENEHLEISEWFRFRCNIDKDKTLSKTVPDDTKNAKSVTETHSYNGGACAMPNAISDLASAILGVRDELLALKCNLSLGDYVVVASLEETDKYVLLDKVI